MENLQSQGILLFFQIAAFWMKTDDWMYKFQELIMLVLVT